jgi:hypothetical protein
MDLSIPVISLSLRTLPLNLIHRPLQCTLDFPIFELRNVIIHWGNILRMKLVCVSIQHHREFLPATTRALQP